MSANGTGGRARVREEQARETAAGGRAHDGADEHRVHEVLGKRAERHLRHQPADVSAAERRDREPSRAGGEAMRGGVVGDPDRRTPVEQLPDGRSGHDGDEAAGPAEEDHRGDPEHERERDSGRVETLEGNREAVGQDHRRCEETQADGGLGPEVGARERRQRRGEGGGACGTDGDDDRDPPRVSPRQHSYQSR